MSAALPESALVTEAQDAFSAAADALAAATTIPSAADLASSLRVMAAVGDTATLDDDLRAGLVEARSRLLAESSPDYWLDVVGVASGDIDSHTAVMATDAADTRRQQAALLTFLLDQFSDPAETDPAAPAETGGTDVR